MKKFFSIIILMMIAMTIPLNVLAASMPTTTITAVKVKDKAVTVKWKKKSSITGYQIQYSTNSKFKKNNKTLKVKKANTTAKKITDLKCDKKYYIRIRTYKGKKYSSWSESKNIVVETSHCTNNNNHSISCGNIGKWFNSKEDIEGYRNNISNKYCQQYENGEITWDEYMKKSPYGYECWSCGYCGKWTGSFKYR